MKLLRKFPYWYLIAIPALLFCLGVVSNQSVLVANHGKFPVMLSKGMYYKYCTPDDPEEAVNVPAISCIKGGEMIDETHSVMGPNSHLKALSDIVPIGSTIYSIGDGLLELGLWLLSFTPIAWLFLTIRKLATLVN
jgi:Family of unknown function (DUF5317)